MAVARRPDDVRGLGSGYEPQRMGLHRNAIHTHVVHGSGALEVSQTAEVQAGAGIDGVSGLSENAILLENIRKLNIYELIGISIRWFLTIDGLTTVDAKAFLEHLEMLCVCAMHDDVKDIIQVE